MKLLRDAIEEEKELEYHLIKWEAIKHYQHYSQSITIHEIIQHTSEIKCLRKLSKSLFHKNNSSERYAFHQVMSLTTSAYYVYSKQNHATATATLITQYP